MSIYRLWKQETDETFDDVDARDDEHALLVFGAILGITLALEGPAAPQYMMKRVGTEEGWSLPPDIPVYEVN
ncbi:MAG: hypothetical protein ISR44_03715 [Rhodospirillales bacterium]|nr:hypothetical protein [Rhodospirillales bacterium]